jgi:hypothetical protein
VLPKDDAFGMRGFFVSNGRGQRINHRGHRESAEAWKIRSSGNKKLLDSTYLSGDFALAGW